MKQREPDTVRMQHDSANTALPTDDDATVAREPRQDQRTAGSNSASPVHSLANGPVEVDLASGSSIVFGGPAADQADGQSAGRPRQPEDHVGEPYRALDSAAAVNVAVSPETSGDQADAATPSVSTGTYFMKPMPQKRGSSFVASSAGQPADLATGLWSRLTVERDSQDTIEPIRLEHFLVERLIGRGGMGAVFLARDTRLNRQVALKVLAPEHTSSNNAIDRFRNEARAAARLDHDNVARVHYLGGALGEDSIKGIGSSALPFIAFEFIEGINVREAIRREGPFSPADTVRFALQLANALREIDACGVVHRDIKPSNVIITPKGRAKLVDLGLARTADPEATHDLTVAGTTLGTFDYISPEQAKDPRTVDARSDIYSLGCTLFHMLIGRPPYPEGTMLQKLLDHQGRIAPGAHSIDPRVPEELSALIQRMMDADPDERPQSPAALLVELSTIASALGIRSGSGEALVYRTVSQKRDPLQEHLGWVIAAACLGFVALMADQFAVPVKPPEPASQSSSAERDTSASANPETGLRLNLSERSPADSQPPGSKRIAETEATTEVDQAATSPNANAVDSLDPVDPDQQLAGPPVPEAMTPSAADRPIDAAVVTQPIALLQQGREILFESLEDALEQARDGSRIEIRDARVTNLSRSIRIAEKSIEIVKSADLRERPRIRLTKPLTSSRTGVKFFDLSNGGLIRLYDVDIEVAVPDSLAELSGAESIAGVSTRPEPAISGSAAAIPWTVFSLTDGCTVELDRTSVTINGAVNPNRVRFFQVASTGSSGSLVASVTLEQCLLRGKATLLHSDGQCSIDAPISETAIAVAGPMLDVIPSPMPRDAANRELSLHIDESSIVSRSPVVRLQADPEDRIGRIRVTADASIFVSLAEEAPLISMSGELYSEDFLALLSWDGSKNDFGAETMWRIESVAATPKEYTSSEWADLVAVSADEEAWIDPEQLAAGRSAIGSELLETLRPEDFSLWQTTATDGQRDTAPKQHGVPWNAPGFPQPTLSSAAPNTSP